MVIMAIHFGYIWIFGCCFEYRNYSLLHAAYFVSGFDLFDQFLVFLQLFTHNLKLFTSRAVDGCAIAANKVSLSDEFCFLSNAALFAASH